MQGLGVLEFCLGSPPARPVHAAATERAAHSASGVEEGGGGVEQYVGNRRIVERALREIDAGRASAILERAGGRREEVSPKVISEAAEAGDALALEIFDFVADCLATMMASTAYLLQPQAFIVGGGVAAAGPVLFDPLRRHLNERLSPYFAERVVIKRAQLGNDAGVIGSATLTFLE